jgi:flavin reductase (DIM6/NTAB) family NADH-FMN oxidoreductase RutF
MSCFPSGVAVVTTVDEQDRPRGMTCTSLTSVSLRPPTLLVCLAAGSGTLTALRQSRVFGVNLLHAGGRAAAELFASPAVNRFAAVRWTQAAALGVPWLVDDAAAIAECAVSAIQEVGDHSVVFGEVVAVGATGKRAPLLYGLREFSVWRPGEPGG